MGGTYRKRGECESGEKILVESPGRKTSLGRLRGGWEYNNVTDLQSVKYDSTSWI
jgi:hypothetical protein